MAQEIEFEGMVAKVVIDSDSDGIRHQITIKTDVEWVGQQAAAFVGKGKFVRVRLRKDWWEQPGLFDGERSINGAVEAVEPAADTQPCPTCQGLGHIEGHGEACESLLEADELTGAAAPCTCGGVDVLCPTCEGMGRITAADPTCPTCNDTHELPAEGEVVEGCPDCTTDCPACDRTGDGGNEAEAADDESEDATVESAAAVDEADAAAETTEARR